MFTKEQLKVIREDVALALKEVEEKHGVSFKLGNITYNEFTFTSKLECKKTSSEVDVDEHLFKSHCVLYGLKAEDYKRIVDIRGKKIELLGFELKRRKYPIKAREIATNQIKLYTTDILEYIK